ncbi:hypothetical protein [Lactovum odontotermitis]
MIDFLMKLFMNAIFWSALTALGTIFAASVALYLGLDRKKVKVKLQLGCSEGSLSRNGKRNEDIIPICLKLIRKIPSKRLRFWVNLRLRKYNSGFNSGRIIIQNPTDFALKNFELSLISKSLYYSGLVRKNDMYKGNLYIPDLKRDYSGEFPLFGGYEKVKGKAVCSLEVEPRSTSYIELDFETEENDNSWYCLNASINNGNRYKLSILLTEEFGKKIRSNKIKSRLVKRVSKRKEKRE